MNNTVTALIACPMCHNQVSPNAPNCPRCGEPALVATPLAAPPATPRTTRKQGATVWDFIGLLAIISGLFAFSIWSAAGAPRYEIIVPSLLVALYLLPWIIAAWREHHNQNAIGMLNLLLGWTLLGWVAALVWSVTAAQRVSASEQRKGA